MEKIMDWVEDKKHVLLLVLIGVIFTLSAALIMTIVKFNNKEDLPETNPIEELMAETIEEGLNEEIKSSSKDQVQQRPVTESLQEVVVDIKGEIDSPGVYQLKEGSRIIDVIEKAGGLRSEADTTTVNFAQLVSDQMVIYIPKVGEENLDNQVTQDGGIDPNHQEDQPIDINIAEKETLILLNGIGQSKAEGIISYREEHGFFQAIEEIKNVSGIGEATFEKLKDSITVSSKSF